jgi:diaminopimelate epimerase
MHTFYKYHGAGNDFVILNDYESNSLTLSIDQIKALCHRRFGIGADGLMILRNNSDYDFEVLYFNADGSGGTLCGNGGRCMVAFAARLNIIKEKTEFFGFRRCA